MSYNKLSSTKNNSSYDNTTYDSSYATHNTDDTLYKTYFQRKYNNVMIGTVVAISLSLCAIGLSSTSYHKYESIQTRVDDLTDGFYTSSGTSHMTSRMLEVQQGVSAMFTGHPSCGYNYTECMNLMHITAHISSHNSTIDAVLSGKFHIGSTDVVVMGSTGNIMATGPGLKDIASDTLEMLHHNLPSPQECHHYSYGTCIFEHNGHLMSYSHILFSDVLHSHSDVDMRRSMDDFFSYGSSGAGMGSAIGGGIAALAGPEAIPIGAAIGGGVGAIVGGTIGAFQ